MNLLALVSAKVRAAYEQAGLPTDRILVKASDRPDMSDYQSNGVLSLAKQMHQNPRELALRVADILKQDEAFSSVTVDGPGFVNMRLSDTVLADAAYPVLMQEKCGYVRKGRPFKIVLDYGGPNIAKTLHVGHLRPHVIGESIKRICRFAGDEVIGDNHIGDWGLPMGLLMAALQERGTHEIYFEPSYEGPYPEAFPLTGKDLERLYPLASQKSKEDPVFLEKAKNLTRRLQEGERGLRVLWHHFVEQSVLDLKGLYEELDVHFDLWRGESHVHERLQRMIKRLKQEGIAVPDQGALIIELGRSTGGNDLPPLILVKSDGAVMYGATDLASVEERMEEFHPDAILYVVDARQGLHFEQVFSAARKIGLARQTELTHLGFGTINGKDNKPFKTRDGGVMTLRKLIDMSVEAALEKMNAGEMGRDLTEEEKKRISKIIGVSALKFADLMNERMKNYIFDVDKLTSVEGKTGPYLLYAIVRMTSLLEKNGATPVITPDEKLIVSTSAERQLLLRLYALPESVQTAYENRAPHVIADYLFKLAQDFNLFYHDCPVKEADEQIRASRLALTKYTRRVALKMADLLGLQIPDKM